MNNDQNSMTVLTCHYCIDSSFRIPIGLDLNNPRMVEYYAIRKNILHIKLADGKYIYIEGVLDYDFAYEYPADGSKKIQDAKDTCYEHIFDRLTEDDVIVAEMIKKLEDEIIGDEMIGKPVPNCVPIEGGAIRKCHYVSIKEMMDADIINRLD